ncbi:glycosyltransferase [Desulfatitalea tepidiphila]|uniref:glycosyltransferase n=1 Tax=Desulfatitalea tepidiphila TaxID=1185843 RepID=UPI0006B5518F|nr:glycosyltransferase [Desulfatitalea tepidiphila]
MASHSSSVDLMEKRKSPMKVLCYSPYNKWRLHGMWETTILKALGLRGVEVLHVLCDGLYSECDMFWAASNPRNDMSCVECQAAVTDLAYKMGMPFEWLGRYVTPNELEIAREWANGIERNHLVDAEYGDWKIGEWVKSSVHTHFRMTRLDTGLPNVRRTYREYLYSGLAACFGLSRLYDQFRPDVLFIFNGRMSSTRIALELARAKGIRFVCHERGELPESVKLVQDLMFFDVSEISQIIWRNWGEVPLSADELDRIARYMCDRRYGKGFGWFSYATPPQDCDEVRKLLGLEITRPVWVLFTSSDDEGAGIPALKGPFPSQLEWIKETVRYAEKHPEIDLVIRVHPNTAGKKAKRGQNIQQLQDMKSLAEVLPSNAKMVMPDDPLSTYSLMDLASVGLVFFSTVGLEMCCRGKQVAVAAGSRISGLPFLHTAKTSDQFYSILDSLLGVTHDHISMDIMRKAYRYAYSIYFRWIIPFPLVKMPDPCSAALGYRSSNELLPGCEPNLDRICRIIIGSEALWTIPSKDERSRSDEEETAVLRKMLAAEIGHEHHPTETPAVVLNAGQGEKMLASRKAQLRGNDGPLPLISIIIPTYNRSQILIKCLEALSKQSLPADKFEVLVCDDGSTDGTEAIVKAHTALFTMRYLRQQNRGPASARNLGIRKAKGQYLLFLNDDAILCPDALELHLKAHAAHAEKRIAVRGRFSFLKKYTQSLFGYMLERTDILFSYSRMQAGKPYDYNYFSTCNTSIPSTAVTEVGLFDEDFTGPAAEDIEMGYRLWKNEYQVLYEPRSVAWHDHAISPEDFLKIHKVRGCGAVTLMVKHPEMPLFRNHNFGEVEAWREENKAFKPKIEQCLEIIKRFDSQMLNQKNGPALDKKIKRLLPMMRLLQEYSVREGFFSSPWLNRLVQIRACKRISLSREDERSAPPLVSVVIPCYNYGRYLSDAVKSVIDQGFQNHEIIIVNDGSTDNTKDVAEKLIADFPECRIRLFNQENSGQPAISRNLGIAAAQGTYILPLDADDKLAPHALSVLVAEASKHLNLPVVVSGWIQTFGVDGTLSKNGPFNRNMILRRNALPYCALYHRSVWEKQGGYRTNVPGYEDWDFWVGATSNGATFIHLKMPVLLYRRTGNGSLLDKACRMHEWLMAGIILNHRQIYESTEVAWAKAYRQHHPQPPENRNVACEIANYPEAMAVLIISHPEHYPKPTVDWAAKFLRERPFVIHMGIDVPESPRGKMMVAERGRLVRAPGRAVGLVHEATADAAYFIQEGEQHFSTGNFTTSIDSFQDTVKLKPDNSTAYNNMGGVNWQLGDKKEAIECVLMASGNDPTDKLPAVNAGKLLSELVRQESTKNIHRSYLRRVTGDETVLAALRQLEGGKMDEEIEPRCSIIIPVFNRFEFTKQCVEAIWTQKTKVSYEIIIIDNGSTDGTQAYLNQIKHRVTAVTNVENRGFAKACNQGAKLSRGHYLLFLNNDTKVLPGWLDAIVQCRQKEDKIGIVGAKLLYPDHTVQHAGVGITDSPNPIHAFHVYHRFAKDAPEVNTERECQAVTGACMLIEKELFDSAGGFDEGFVNGYEDVDLCFRVRELGRKVIYCPTSELYHYESRSEGRFSAAMQNVKRLHQKWMGKIVPDIKNSRISVYSKLTSIIVLTFNQLEYTKKCIDSVFACTRPPFELIMVDNGSSDGTTSYLRQVQKESRCDDIQVKIVENKKNIGFAAGNNRGLAQADGDYIVLLNNDVVVTPGWLEKMIDCVNRFPMAGIVGPMTNYVAGEQLVQSVGYDPLLLENLNEFSSAFYARHQKETKCVLRVVGFCMLIKRAVIEKIGGLDERYGLGNFEDDDFSLRARFAGFQSWIAGDCFVHHFGSRTFRGEGIAYNETIKKNWQLFKQKWQIPQNLPHGAYNLTHIGKKDLDKKDIYVALENEKEAIAKNDILEAIS